MDPSEPSNFNANPGTANPGSGGPGAVTPPPGPPPPKKWGRFPRKVWIIGVAGLAVVVVGAVLLGGSGPKPGGTQKQADVYYDRQGFDRSKLSSGIGDPAPLVSKTVSSAATYKGSKVVQACNLLTPEGLRKLGLNLEPGSLTNIDRIYFDGQGQGALTVRTTTLASIDDANECSFPIHQPQGRIDIDVYQPAYNSPEAIDYEIGRRFKEAGTVEGFKQYVREEEDKRYYILRNGGDAVQIYIRKIQDPQVVQKLVTAVAGNFKRLLAAPDGPVQFSYDSPTFDKSYLNGCSVTTASDVQGLFGASVKPLVEERVSSATGVIIFPDQAAYNLIEHACVRRVSGSGLGDRRSLTLESTSFTSTEGAKKKIESDKRFDAKITPVPTRIGDEVYFSYTTGQNPEMTIRKGRFVMNLSMFDQTRQLTDQQMIQALTPVAQAIVGRIKDF